jgi:hypothetical protein
MFKTGFPIKLGMTRGGAGNDKRFIAFIISIFVWCFEHLDFDIIWNLEFWIWCFREAAIRDMLFRIGI